MKTRVSLWLAALAVLAGGLAGWMAWNAQTPAIALEEEPFYLERGWFPMHKQSAVKLNGNASWVDSGLNVVPGFQIRVVANGSISFKSDYNRTPLRKRSPDGDKAAKDNEKVKDKIHYFADKLPMPDGTPFILIGRIISRNGKVKHGPFEIGRDFTLTVPAEGTLEVTTNDDNKSDNTGYWRVTMLMRKMPGIEPFGKPKP